MKTVIPLFIIWNMRKIYYQQAADSPLINSANFTILWFCPFN